MTLKEVLSAHKKNDLHIFNEKKKGGVERVKQKTNAKVGGKRNQFTKQEDEIIMAAMDEAGDRDLTSLDFAALARRLDRNQGSVHSRVRGLMRNGGVKRAKRPYTFLEDKIMMEVLILPRLKHEKLSSVFLQNHHCSELSKQWNKAPTGLMNHWSNYLQPMLLQHYSGTLNLRIERMLSEHIARNYTDFSKIDWPRVAARAEFAGHTEKSLRNRYFMTMSNGSTRLKSGEMTPQHVAQYCEAVYGEGGQGGRMGSKKIQRQTDVIAFFEDKVAELGVVDFL